MKINILPSESVTVIGMKGSGKTTVLKQLIKMSKPTGTRRVVILDTKQVGDFSEYPLTPELKDIHKLVAENPISVYAPIKAEKHDPRFIEGFFEWCYDRWNTCVVIDELTSIVWGNDVPESYKDITDRGRAKNITIWQGNQKPVYVPHAALSEADHFFLFDLMVESDRKKMSGIMGNRVMQRPKDPHGFWYLHKHMKNPEYLPGIKI